MAYAPRPLESMVLAVDQKLDEGQGRFGFLHSISIWVGVTWKVNTADLAL